jgi:hypothetical protein
LSLWGFAKPVLLAVAIAPAVTIVVGLVHRFLTKPPAMKDLATVLIGSPIVYAVFLILAAIPALILTSISAGAMTAVKGYGPAANVLLWAVAPACLAYMWVAMNRYPDGDGGSMQSMVEQIKATCAASVAVWCVMATRA